MLLRVKERLNMKLLEAILNLLKHRCFTFPVRTVTKRNVEAEMKGLMSCQYSHVVKRNQVNEKEWNKIIQEEMNINQASFNLVTGPLMRSSVL